MNSNKTIGNFTDPCHYPHHNRHHYITRGANSST